MTDNNIDMPDMNNIEPPEGDNSTGAIIGWILGILGALGLGFFWGNAGKKKAVVAAYEKGYKDASGIFEKKFKLLHDAFVSKEKDWNENEKEYLQLISDYEEYIEQLESEEGDENKGKIKFFEDKLEELRGLEESC